MTDHIFISYARRDGADYAIRFETLLPQHGFSTWRDERGIDPTQDFTVEIERAIEDAAYVLAIITPDSRRPESYVRREIGYALTVKKPIIVAEMTDVPAPVSVSTHTFLKFYEGWDAAFQQLLRWLNQLPGELSVPGEIDDPYHGYLKALYQQIVNYLDKTVFSMLPGGSRASLISLQAEATPEAVDAPEEIAAQVLPMAFFDMAGVADDNTDEPKQYDNFHAALEAYDGRMLLLGEPGAGKTTTLFAYARDSVAQRISDPAQPLPILAPIALWDAEKQPSMAEWLAEIIPALKEHIAQILTNGSALLILDGLDELGSEREIPETKENYDPRQRFLQIVPENNQVLSSSRVKDYEGIGDQLTDGEIIAVLAYIKTLWTAEQKEVQFDRTQAARQQ